MNTFATILDRADIECPNQALADVDVPVITGRPQRQGDVGIWPTTPATKAMLTQAALIGQDGIHGVRGESAGANAHILHADGTVYWTPASGGDLLALGTLTVTPGAVAWLIHTDEHGVNGIGTGTYQVTGKREMGEQARRVAD